MSCGPVATGGMRLGGATRVAAAMAFVLHAGAFAPGLAPGGHRPAVLGRTGSSLCAQSRGRVAMGGRMFGLRGASMIDWTDKQVAGRAAREGDVH